MAAPLPPSPVLAPSRPASDRVRGGAGVRPGQLTTAWRVLTALMWAFVLVAFTGVWKASRELGLATWWLGPQSEPQPVFVMLAPLYLPAAMAFGALNNVRRLPWLGLGASAATAAIGVVDLTRVTRLGLVELALAASGAVFSLASFAGAYRRP